MISLLVILNVELVIFIFRILQGDFCLYFSPYVDLIYVDHLCIDFYRFNENMYLNSFSFKPSNFKILYLVYLSFLRRYTQFDTKIDAKIAS